MSDSEITIFDFDKTLTTTDTIKITIASLLLGSPWRLFRVLRRYRQLKREQATPEMLKHSLIGILLAGHGERGIQQCMKVYGFVTRRFILKEMWNRMLVQNRNGIRVVIATASPYIAVDIMVRKYNIPVIGTEYESRDGKYTGRPLEPIPFQNGKMVAVNKFMKENRIASIACSYTDSLSDLPLLQASRRGYLVDKDGKVQLYSAIKGINGGSDQENVSQQMTSTKATG